MTECSNASGMKVQLRLKTPRIGSERIFTIPVDGDMNEIKTFTRNKRHAKAKER